MEKSKELNPILEHCRNIAETLQKHYDTPWSINPTVLIHRETNTRHPWTASLTEDAVDVTTAMCGVRGRGEVLQGARRRV